MKSHREIFRSSFIIGGASVINMVIGIVKVKILALLLGPAGVGLMGVYQNIVGTAAKLSGLGLDSSGVRQVAAYADDAETLSAVRRALWLGNLVLGISGSAVLWLIREPVAQWIFDDASQAGAVGWLGAGIFLTLISGSQTAVLQGLRRINDIALVNILSALVAAILGTAAVYLLGTDGVLWFVLTAPAVNFVVATYFANRLPEPQAPVDLAAIRQQWKSMLGLGIPMMSAGLLLLITQLAIRSFILRDFGLAASGYFQAAWAISMTYIGFVLNAMAMDFYPRLTTVVNDRVRARGLVNEQAEMALLLSAPVLLAMITLAPWVIRLLYADSFGPATDILRWQVLGDILKVASWPMGFIFLAAGRGALYVFIQVVWSAVYLGSFILGSATFGLEMSGIGFAAAYAAIFLLVLFLARRQIGLKATRRNSSLTLVLLLSGGLVIYLSEQSQQLAYVAGTLLTALVSLYCLHRLNGLINLTGWLRKRFR